MKVNIMTSKILTVLFSTVTVLSLVTLLTVHINTYTSYQQLVEELDLINKLQPALLEAHASSGLSKSGLRRSIDDVREEFESIKERFNIRGVNFTYNESDNRWQLNAVNVPGILLMRVMELLSNKGIWVSELNLIASTAHKGALNGEIKFDYPNLKDK